MRFLIIEDNERLARLVAGALQEHGYEADIAATGRRGEELAAGDGYDGIILDVMLPDYDGVDLCRALRRKKVATPVLMLTALSSTADKVAGLDAGADDYLTKPFEIEELVARVRALLRRADATEGSVLRYADIELDLMRREVSRGGQSIGLTQKEFALLEYFVRNPDRVLTRSVIGQHVWDMNFEEDSNVVEVYVSRLRRKADKGFEPPLIHTVIGSGYLFSRTPPAT